MPDPIRSIHIRTEIPDASRPRHRNRGMADLVWYQGETVQIRVSLQALGLPVSITPNHTVKLIAWQGEDLSSLFIDRTGSIVSAPGGYVQVTLPPNLSALPAGAYHAQIKVISPGGEQVGIGLSGLAQVLPSPDGTAIFDGPFTNVNWSTVTQYEHTAGSGPIRLGPGLAYETNQDGSITIRIASEPTQIMQSLILHNPDTQEDVRLTVRGDFNQIVRENINE